MNSIIHLKEENKFFAAIKQVIEKNIITIYAIEIEDLSDVKKDYLLWKLDPLSSDTYFIEFKLPEHALDETFVKIKTEDNANYEITGRPFRLKYEHGNGPCRIEAKVNITSPTFISTPSMTTIYYDMFTNSKIGATATS